MLIAALLFPATLFAAAADDPYSPADYARRRAALVAFQQVANNADEHLPPCEGLDRLSDEAFRSRPSPRLCPKAAAFMDYLSEMDRRLRDNCRELSDFMTAKLREPGLCPNKEGSNSPYRLAQDKLRELRRSAQPGLDADGNLFEDPRSTALNGDLDDFGQPKGEFRNMDCALPVTVGMQYRKRALELANRHYSKADITLGTTCDGTDDAIDGYFEFLRHGEDER